jgi:tRNA(Phe) wybutosine-synthesizing methylase Tyw3
MPRKLNEIAQVLGVKVSWLVSGNNDTVPIEIPDTKIAPIANLVTLSKFLTAKQLNFIVKKMEELKRDNESVLNEVAEIYRR